MMLDEDTGAAGAGVFRWVASLDNQDAGPAITHERRP
jgi:hypothetical protein